MVMGGALVLLPLVTAELHKSHGYSTSHGLDFTGLASSSALVGMPGSCLLLGAPCRSFMEVFKYLQLQSHRDYYLKVVLSPSPRLVMVM